MEELGDDLDEGEEFERDENLEWEDEEWEGEELEDKVLLEIFIFVEPVDKADGIDILDEFTTWEFVCSFPSLNWTSSQNETFLVAVVRL